KHFDFLLSDQKKFRKFCINEVGRRKVYGIPDSSMIFSSCLCSRPIIVTGLALAPMTDNFTTNPTSFFFASFTKLEETSVMLGVGGIAKKSLSTLYRAPTMVSCLL